MNDASKSTSKPTLYPRYCFHLAPTVNTWSFFHAAEIHGLDHHDGFEGENFYFYNNLPIKWVRIVGVVVAIDEFSGRRVYTVDDSSGACIECAIVLPRAPKEDKEDNRTTSKGAERAAPPTVQPFPDIDVCSVVDVKGGLSTFRDEKQINIEKMHALKSTAQEVALWERRARFRKDVLDKPWVLGSREIQRCRKEAERSEEEAMRKRRQLKARLEAQASRQLVALTKEPVADSSRENKRRKKTSRDELRKIIADSAKGKYDALGL